MKNSTKVLTAAGVGVGVGVATVAFLKTEKGQEVKEVVKDKITTVVNEIDAFIKESQEATGEVMTRPVVRAKFFDIKEDEEMSLIEEVGGTTEEEQPTEL